MASKTSVSRRSLIGRSPFLPGAPGRQLVQTALVATALEARGQEALDDRTGEGGAQDAAPQAENVRTIVGPRELGLELVVAARRPYPRHLVGRDRHADPGPTDQNAQQVSTSGDAVGHSAA